MKKITTMSIVSLPPPKPPNINSSSSSSMADYNDDNDNDDNDNDDDMDDTTITFDATHGAPFTVFENENIEDDDVGVTAGNGFFTAYGKQKASIMHEDEPDLSSSASKPKHTRQGKSIDSDDEDNDNDDDTEQQPRSVSSSLGRYASVTKESIKSLTSQVDQLADYAESTMKKRSFIRERYRFFCHTAEINPVPFRYNYIKAFGITLGEHYRLTSLEYNFVPGLKDVYTECTNTLPNVEVKELLSKALKSLKHHADNKGGDMKSVPILRNHVIDIIKAMPIHLPKRAYDVSAIVLAFNTGARVSSIVNIKLEDIVYVKPRVKGGYRMQILYTRMKGSDKPHKVTIKGNVYDNPLVNDTAVIDPFNWMRIYIQEEFGLDLLHWNRHTLPDHQRKLKIWDDTEDNMSKRFALRADKAGYTDARITFHSLRSGFISQAIFDSRSSTIKSASVLTKAASVGNWRLEGKAIKGYTKDIDGQIIANNLVSGDQDDDDDDDQWFDDDQVDPDVFLGINVGESTWSMDTNLKGLVDMMRKRAKEDHPDIPDHQFGLFFDNFMKKAFYHYGKGINEIKSASQNEPNDMRGAYIIKEGRKRIAKYLYDDPTKMETISNNFYNKHLSQCHGYADGTLPDFVKDKKPNTVDRRKQRKKWTDEEVQVLRDAYKKYKNHTNKWIMIKDELAEHGFTRTNTDCKDKMRNLGELDE